ncbi:hypothetical protein ACOME3_000192 [Neoechinorhynchus agilis]
MFESSLKLRQMQAETLLGLRAQPTLGKCYKLASCSRKSKMATQIQWTDCWNDVQSAICPGVPVCVLANEFLDALPIHQKTGNQKYGEICINFKDSRLYYEMRSFCDPKIMLCPAYRNHKQEHPLENPGDADLTADVDFSLIKNFVCDKFPGRMFACLLLSTTLLQRLWFMDRLNNENFFWIWAYKYDLRQNLLAKCTNENDATHLITGYRYLMEEMGSAFKFLSFQTRRENRPPGFY